MKNRILGIISISVFSICLIMVLTEKDLRLEPKFWVFFLVVAGFPCWYIIKNEFIKKNTELSELDEIKRQTKLLKAKLEAESIKQQLEKLNPPNKTFPTLNDSENEQGCTLKQTDALNKEIISLKESILAKDNKYNELKQEYRSLLKSNEMLNSKLEEQKKYDKLSKAETAPFHVHFIWFVIAIIMFFIALNL